MKSTLIIYSSTDGQTKNICLRIGETLSNDVPPKIISLSEASSSDIEKYDQIIIGASIRYGKHKKELFEFLIGDIIGSLIIIFLLTIYSRFRVKA